MTRKLQLDFITLDVFTQVRYTGNPLAIVKVPPSETLTQQQKQMIAREFNYSETVILHELQQVDHDPQWNIDIFLTTAEIPFAGHPTVGTACFLGEQLLDLGRDSDQINGTLITKAGLVAFAYLRQSKTAQCDVPHDVHVHPRTLTTEDAQTVGLPRAVYENIVNSPPFVSLVKGVTFALVQLPTEDVLGAVPANLSLLKSHDGLDKDWAAKGSTVGFFFFVKVGQAEEGVPAILRTRMILGSFEDPATGSASSTLAAYLALHEPYNKGESATNQVHKFQMVQGVEMGRKSVIGVEVIAKHSRIDRITLTGSAACVMEGSLVI
jgi:PhzF family phenazine biosynthesis protein